MGPIIGIDLGTLNSCVAVVRGRTPLLIASHGGQKSTPSMVTITRGGERVVGLMAKRQATTNAENTVRHTKRLLSRNGSREALEEALSGTPLRVVEGPQGEPQLRIRERSYSVAQLAAMILGEMRGTAERFLCQEVARAVIAVPAHFDEGQRATLREAGSLAGLDVLRILDEPTAAAIAHGLHTGASTLVAVYDLGGGGFQVSLLRFRRGTEPELLRTAADSTIGGEVFDERIMSWLLGGFEDKHGIDLRRDRMAMQRLKDGVERARCELSFARETEISLPYLITSTEGIALHMRQPLSRARFEELTTDLVERSLDLVEATLREAGVERDQIDHLVLAGGVSRTPAVRASVSELFDREPEEGPRPDEVVALGAAICGSMIDRPSKRLEIATVEMPAAKLRSGSLEIPPEEDAEGEPIADSAAAPEREATPELEASPPELPPPELPPEGEDPIADPKP